MVYASHVMNRMPSSAIRGKVSEEFWSGETAQNYGLLRVFGCPTYFHVKKGKLNPQAKEFSFLGVKRNLKSYICETIKTRSLC